MKETVKKRQAARLKRKRRVRKKVSGSPARPRLSVFRSHRNIYAQVVDDEGGRTLVAACSLKLGEHPIPEGIAAKCAVAYRVGRQLAEVAREAGIGRVVFDRSGYLYHGRVAALARGVRDGGIEF